MSESNREQADMAAPYTPIACALHDEYEIAVMHKTPLRLKWKDANGQRHEENVLPVDINVSNGEEFLLVKTAGGHEIKKIRLDRILDKKSG